MAIVAGPFSAWLTQARASLQGEGGADVPCGDCVGCCTSSYFIPLRPTDTAALDDIPAQYLVSAPGEPRGHWMMGYLANGACPMMKERQCTIYAHRPQTCRDYDCRIFAAAGIDAGGPEKVVINDRVRAWEFSYPTATDRQAHDAVLAAADFIQSQRKAFPGARAPTAPTGIAVLAIKVYALFLQADALSRTAAQTAEAIIHASRAFDAASAA